MQKNLPSEVVYYYSAWYVFLRDRRYSSVPGQICMLCIVHIIKILTTVLIYNEFGLYSRHIVSNEFLGNQSKKIKNKNFVNLQLLGRAPWWQKLFIIDYYWEQWLRNVWISLTFQPLITFLSVLDIIFRFGLVLGRLIWVQFSLEK